MCADVGVGPMDRATGVADAAGVGSFGNGRHRRAGNGWSGRETRGERNGSAGAAGRRDGFGSYLITGNKFFLRSLAFLNDIGLGRPAGCFGLFAQDFLCERIGHVDDGGIDIFLVRTQSEEIRRDAHNHIHQRKVDKIGQITGDRVGGLEVTRREMGDQFLERDFHFAGGKLAQDQVHGETDFGGGGAGGFKFGEVRREDFGREAAENHADGQVDASRWAPVMEKGLGAGDGAIAACTARKNDPLGGS